MSTEINIKKRITALDESVILTKDLSTINFVGAGVVASTIAEDVTVTISGGIAGSGTTNYVSKFTSSSALGNSQIQDDGTTVSINDVPQANISLWVKSTKEYGFASENTKTTSNTYGVYGGAIGIGKARGVGVYGESSGGTLSNIGTEGVGVGGTVAIGGKFTGSTATTNYSVQLQDGTEGAGKVLTSMTADGKAQWVAQTVAAGIIYITNQTTGAITYYTTLELASAGAVSGDTIYVNTGTYTITTTATNGIAKSGVNWYFKPGAIVNKATAGHLFNDIGFVNSCNVYGYGIFNKTITTGKIYNAVTSLDLMFECFSESSTTDDIFLIGGVSKKVIINHYSSISSAGRVINGQGSTTELVINFNSMTSTSSNVIGGGLNQIKMNLNGNLIRSTTSVAISDIWNFSQVISNVTNVYGVGYGFNLNNGNPTTLVINGNTTGVIASVGDIAMNGNCTNLNISGAKFIGGIVGSITCSSGSINTSWVGYAGVFAISGGKTILNIPISTVGVDRMAFSLTGGKLIINGDYQEDYYSRYKLINGATAELIINGDFICTATNPAEIYGGFFNLNNGTLRLKGRIKTSLSSYNEPLILWTGGKIIIENGKLVNGMTTAPPIVASASGLVMKVLGTAQTNFVDGAKSIFEARKQFYKFTISNVATTNLTINLGALIIETNTGVYNTKALLAQRMASLINSSYANTVVIATYTLSNDYFEIEALVAGTPYVTGSEANLSIYKTILNSYLITDLTNGLITQNVNVE